jgi:hypothetical protein
VRTRICLALMVPVLMLAVAACGASKDSDIPTANGKGAAPSGGTSLSSEEQKERRLKFTQCMREQGVDMPDPEKGEFGQDVGGVSKEKMNAATEACRQYLPTDEELSQPSAEDVETLRKFAQCIREHGVPNFPDPGPDGGLNIGGTGIDPKDPKVKAAEEACKDLRPKRPGS